jgi:putative PIN family toxin of toxin-antitoxin system
VLDYDRIKKHLPLDRVSYLTFIRSISTLINSEDFQIKSPDPEDNYLYNLALTANAKLLVTGENALLQWKEAPVETINLTTFRQLF